MKIRIAAADLRKGDVVEGITVDRAEGGVLGVTRMIGYNFGGMKVTRYFPPRARVTARRTEA